MSCDSMHFSLLKTIDGIELYTGPKDGHSVSPVKIAYLVHRPKKLLASRFSSCLCDPLNMCCKFLLLAPLMRSHGVQRLYTVRMSQIFNFILLFAGVLTDSSMAYGIFVLFYS